MGGRLVERGDFSSIFWLPMRVVSVRVGGVVSGRMQVNARAALRESVRVT